VIPLLDELSDEARAMGAVNTVVFAGGRATGPQHRRLGLALGLSTHAAGCDLSRVVLLGAGGAGSAIAHRLCRMRAARAGGRRQRCGACGVARAELTASTARERASAGGDAARRCGRDGLVHATPTGMDKLPGLPLAAELLRPDLWVVAEIVYFPLETALLKAARARRMRRVVDGGTMAVGQAVGAFELFTRAAEAPIRMRTSTRTLAAW
jgi:shikimate dehydrogenase